jgi:serine/threonine-protein kinase
MGVVYRARDPIINRLVALKTITTGLADDPNLLQRFYREAQSAGGLQHPNIVTIYDMGDEQNTPYIAMELIDGESLEQMIANRASVPVVLKLTYALQACRAFDYAHKRGIVHRDIKPGNVMVNKESVVKVVDFGIARVMDTSKTQTGMLIGTFAYMSPEQYQGEHADERSDIWSFGVLLYELLCYQRPFTGENPASLMHAICSQEPRTLGERVPDCPAAMEGILSKLLRKSPQDRFQSMEDVLLELEPVYKELQARSIAGLIDQSRQCIDKGEFVQARELLRELLKVDSSNSQARALLEKVNAELKRLLIRPKAQQYVDKGRALLEEGRIQEARTEAENALELDSTFGQAQDLEIQVQRKLDSAQKVAEWLQTSGQRLAEGKPEEAEELLAKVLEMEPANKQANDLERQVQAEKAERQRRLRLLEKMQEARALWTQLNYDGGIRILDELQKEFPGEEEVQRLLDTVREDQAEQHRQKTLEGARNLLAVGNYAESRGLLVELQKQFPSDEISALLEDIRLEEAKQRKLQGLSEARNYLANKQYDKSIVMLTALEQEFRDDREISELLQAAQEDQAEQQRQQGIAEARNLLTARRYDECAALVTKLQKRFPNDHEIEEIQKAIREDQTQERKQASLAKARNLLSTRHYEESIALISDLGKEFPSDEEIRQLLQTAQTEQTEQQRQKGIAEVRNLLAARGYGGCNVLLEKLLKEFPNDPELLELKKAVRAEQAEQHRLQGIAEARNLLAARKYDECNALLAKLGEQFPDDPDIRQLQKAIEEVKAEQRKLESLAKARNLLASKNYEESIALLTEMGREFSSSEDIGRLLKTAREGQAEQQRQQGIAEARNLLSARRYDDCNALVANLAKRFPNDSEISQLQEGIREGRAEQEKLGILAKARNLLAKRNYDECIALLNEVTKTFLHDEEVPKLLATAREGLAEQRKLKSLAEARSLLAARRYDDSISLLTELKKEFPEEREVTRLLANAGKEQAEQQKQQKLAEARALLAAQRFGEALALLDTLLAAHPKDTAVQKLRELVDRESDKQNRSERLQRELEALKKLVSEKKYPELLARAEPLKTEFPSNGDLLRLIDFARNQQSQIEAEKRLRTAIDDVKAHIRANRFADAIRAADAGLKAFPAHAELVYLREQAEAQEKKQRARGMIEQRIREIKFKINRADLSEAIDLAKQTIAVVGPDADLTQLLNSAVVEFEAREKKRQQEKKLQEIRTMMESGNVDGAAETLHDAVETETLDSFDPRVGRVSQEIDAAKSTPTVVSPTAAPSAPANFSKEYAFLQGRPLEAEPPPTENVGPTETGVPQASATQPTISSQPAAMPPPQFVAAPPPPETPAVIRRPEPIPVPIAPADLTIPVLPARVREPVRVSATPRATAAPPRDFKKIATLAAVALALIVGVWATVHLVSSHKTEQSDLRPAQPINTDARGAADANPPAAPTVPAKPAVNPAEAQQRSAIERSNQLVAANQLDGALKTLQQAAAINGPLTSDIKKKMAGIEESMADANLRELRRREAVLWQQAVDDVAGGRNVQARRTLQQVLSLPSGGVRREEAQKYLDEVVPQHELGAKLAAQAQRELSEGQFQAALQDASQIEQKGVDAKQVRSAIYGAMGDRLSQLKTQFNQLKLGNDQAAIDQLEALRPKFQALTSEGSFTGSVEAQAYVNNIPGAINDVQGRIHDQSANAAFRQMEQRYQQAMNAHDKDGLVRARSDFQSVVDAGGRHAGEAKTYLSNITSELAQATEAPALPAPAPVKKDVPSAKPADSEAAIRAVIQAYAQAFEHKDADALRQIWPTIGDRYTRYKNSFGNASSIRMKIVLVGPIQQNADGTTATVQTSVTQDFGLKGSGTTSHKDSATFQLVNKGGVWSIADVQ